MAHADRPKHGRAQYAPGRIRRFVGSLTAMALVATGAVVGAPAAHAAGTTDGTVAGTVFQDFSSTGWYTAGDASAAEPRDVPVEDVLVTAFDAQGDEVGSVRSAADGSYTLDVQDAFSDAVRLELSDWPAEYEPAFAAQPPTPGSALGANDTSVQFATLGDTDVDFGLIIPDEVVQPDAPIATAIQYAGAQSGTAASPLAAVVAQPWSIVGDSGDAGWPQERTTFATYEQVGSIWGLSYNRAENFLVAAASLKRMSALGGDDLGGVYRADDVLAPDGTPTGTPGGFWFSVDGLPIVGGGSIDLGSSVADFTAAGRGLGESDDPSYDVAAFANAARVGMGAIATTLDGDTLFVTNLHDHQVYSIDISDPSAVTEARAVGTPVGANQQLWALAIHEARLFVGIVDTGTQPGHGAADQGMNAYVYSIPISAANTGGATAGDWTLEFQMDLGYVKGSNMNGWNSDTPGLPLQDKWADLRRWNAWTDQWTWDASAVPGDPVTGSVEKYNPSPVQVYPQPILSGLAWDIDGYLVLGFTDRTAIQSGNFNVAAVDGSPVAEVYETLANGDILTAAPRDVVGTPPAGCPDPGSIPGNYVLECNGSVGDRAVRTSSTPYTLPGGAPSAGYPGQDPTFANGQGPLSGEFYNDAQNLGFSDYDGDPTSNFEFHNENALGAVATYPGVDEVVSTATDPLDGLFRSGLMWFDERDGTATRGFDQVRGINDHGTPEFQKGGGLGAVALLAVAAPVEIGNYVWLDADLNGRQDPDEPAINGAPVQLWTAGDNGAIECLIGETTTATINGNPGTYYFRTDEPDLQNVSCAATGTTVSFTPDDEYFVVFPEGSGAVTLEGANANHEGFAGLEWDDLARTVPFSTKAATSTIDSNADADPDRDGWALVAVGGPGQNDHTIDAGWYATNTYELTKDVVMPDAAASLIPGDQEFTVTVEAAKNFRGEDRLTAAGDDPPPGDPQIIPSEVTFTLTGGQTITTTQELPIGYELTFSETDDTGAVQESTPNTGDPQEGRVLITPRGGADLRAGLEVTNAYGGFSVLKTVDPPGSVPDDTEFSVTYRIGDDGEEITETVTVGNGFSVTGIPIGTTVFVREDTPLPDIPGVEWGDPTWVVGGSSQEPDGDGWVSVEITDSDALVEFALTNNATLLGALQVTKTIDGDQEAIDAVGDIEFTVNWETTNLTPQQSGSFTVSSDGTAAPDPALVFPEGTEVVLTEVAPTNLPPGVSWDGAAWTAATNIVVSDDGSTATVTIEPGLDAPTVATLTNTFLNDLGAFEVSKQLTGDFALTDPEFANVEIPIDYSYIDPATTDLVEGTLTLNAGNGFTATGPTLPAGTEVTVSEGTPTGAPPNVSWGSVSWSVDGNDVDPPVTFTIADDTTVALVVTNEVTEVFGTFQVCKDFSGDFDPAAPELADVVITVTWTAPDQTTGTLELTQDGQWCAEPVSDAGGPVTFPLGTVIAVEETGITGGTPDLEFGDVSWNPANPSDPTQGLVTISSETTPATATVTNGTTQLLGTFSIAKEVDGDFDLTSPEMAGAMFTVTASWPDGPGLAAGTVDLILNQANGWMTGLGQNLPTGTVVTLSEATPTGTGPSVDWGVDAAWSGDGITDNGDGTASITIGDGTNPALTVTNTATELRGTFEASKLVTGDFDLTDPQLENAVFTVAWSASDGQSGSFDLTGPDWTGGPMDAGGAVTFPLGTTVTLSEPTISGTGPDVAWGDVSWSPGDQGDGTAVITISDDQTPAQVELTNEVTELTGTFGVAKQLSGDFALTDPEMQDAVFTVTASWDAAPGLDAGSVELVLDSSNNWALPAGVTLPTGTVVTLSEVSATGTGPSVQWGDATWSGDGLTVNDDGTASFLIGDNTAPTFTVTNEVTELTGTFGVAKDVVGDFDLTDPEMQDAVFTATASWDAAPGLDAGSVDLVLDSSNGWAAPSGVDLPTGTTVTMSEVSISGTGPSVQWDGASWSGDGLTVNDDGTASFVIGDGTNPEFSLTNEATELLGMFSVTKLVTGGVLVPLDTAFTVTYTYDGLETPGTLEVTPGQTVTSPAIPVGTVVTISEIAPTGTLPEGASWGTPQFVLPDGTTTPTSVTITITEADETVAVELTNPVIPPLPRTGSDTSPWALAPLGVMLLLAGAGVWLIGRRGSVTA